MSNSELMQKIVGYRQRLKVSLGLIQAWFRAFLDLIWGERCKDYKGDR
ncbi:hypothetical protein ACQ4M4_10140 [Leptolyngbya sp. AN02str]